MLPVWPKMTTAASAALPGRAHPTRTHRFPPPWIAEEIGACFVVRDHNRWPLARGGRDGEADPQHASRVCLKLTEFHIMRIGAMPANWSPSCMPPLEREIGALVAQKYRLPANFAISAAIAHALLA